jgi:hypothetical protein
LGVLPCYHSARLPETRSGPLLIASLAPSDGRCADFSRTGCG